MFNTLDFVLLNKVIKAPIFISIDDDDLKALKQIPQTHDRLQVALRFAWYIGGDEKTLPSKDENERRNLREGYLRASLTEFASIEETLKRDVINLPQSPQPLFNQKPFTSIAALAKRDEEPRSSSNLKRARTI